jgi:1-acyl-sn-glycerol-3-phosphate acyltransferase
MERLESGSHAGAGPAAAARLAVRLPAAVVVTAVSYLAAVAGAALLAASPRRRAAWRHRVLRRWARLLLRVVGGRLEVAGEPPAPPFLLVANHVSWVDILVLGATAGGAFVAKVELARSPVVGAVCRAGGVLFIDRGAKRDLLRAGREVGAQLDAGGGVVLFLEGTTGSGAALLPFKPSLLEVAATSGVPVHYATVSYSTPEVCWWGDAPFGPHARRLLGLPGFTARVAFGAEPVRDGDRKRLAVRLREAMTALFEPSR